MSILRPEHQEFACHLCNKNKKELVLRLRALISQLEPCQKDLPEPTKQCTLLPPRKLIPRKIFEKEDHPYKPWALPRMSSRELIGGVLYKECVCKKRNGLQDQCERLLCRSRPACFVKPEPICPPSGIWKQRVTQEFAEKIIDFYHKEREACTQQSSDDEGDPSSESSLIKDTEKSIVSDLPPKSDEAPVCEKFILAPKP